MSVHSYWYTPYFSQVLVATPPYGGWKAAAGDTFKIMLMTPSYIPNQDTHGVKADLSGEVVGPGYVAGGQTLASKTISVVAGNLVVGASAVTWGNCTFVTNRAVVYDDSNPLPASKQLMFWIDFGQIIDLNNQTIKLTFDGQGNVTVDVTPPVDVTAPTLQQSSVNANPLILSFSEPLNAQLVPAPGDFAVTVNAAPVVINAVAIVGANVTLTLAVAIVNGNVVTVAYTKPVLNHLEDLAGNDVLSFTAQPVTNSTPPPIPPPDTTPPAILDALCVGNQITISYDEQLNQSVVPATTSYAVTVNGVADVVSSVNVLGSNVALALSTPASQGQTILLSYTPGANKIQDAAGNFAAALTNFSVVNNSPDITPPVLTSAEINTTQLTLSYDKPLNASFTPATTAYDIKKNGVSQALNLVFVTVNSQVIITLANPVINTDVITAAYSRPPVNYLRDLNGNPAGSFLNFPVQNLTAPAPPLVDDATFSGQTVPSLSMNTSTSQNVKVTMKNTGTTSWDANGYQLRSQNPVGNTNWGLSTVPVPSPTPPTASSLFDFSITAPGTPGNYNFQWRMHKIGGADFGVASSNVVIAVNAVVSGKTWFVSTSGNDTTGTGSQLLPFRTIAKGLSAMAGGDTLYIRGGSYPEFIDTTTGSIVRSGTSWAQPTTIARFGSETVILNPSGTHHVVFIANGQSYVVFDGIIFDGINQTPRSSDWSLNRDTFKVGYPSSPGVTGAAHHIRAINCEMKNAAGQGVLNIENSHHCEVINCKIHDNGSNDHDHGVYWGGADGLIEKCEIYRNYGQGVQIFNSAADVTTYPPDRIIVRGNYIHNNAYGQIILGGVYTSTDLGRGTGIILSSHGNGQQAYNNIIVDNNGGIRVDYYNVNTLVYNNTVYNNNHPGASASLAGIYIGSQSTGAVVKNNIVFQNNGSITNLGVSTVQSNNPTANPLFVNGAISGGYAVGHDFHLTAGSPAINAGLNLSSVFTNDFDGVLRPASGPWEAGAYEFV